MGGGGAGKAEAGRREQGVLAGCQFNKGRLGQAGVAHTHRVLTPLAPS